MREFKRGKNAGIALCAALLILPLLRCVAGNPDEVTILDGRHYSSVFGETRNYRIFLPPGYFEHPEKRYPVIYFFHGWSQRYFGSSNPYGDFDKGDDNGGDNIANFVGSHDVIVVKPDGYNRSPDELYYVRPYNVSPVETYRQFPLYFPELVATIDAQFRTIADREHRGISGLSMGGFMTWWIGGKYPDMLCAAGNFCGSAEFTVGPKDFPVEYRHLDMYDNYGGMNVRLHYGDEDFIRGYHDDLNRVWPQVMDNYNFKMFHAAHSTCGMGEMFSFILGTFAHPPARPARWAHTDVYPEFSVWDYHVTTDRTVPGFTKIEKVDARGFRCSAREFLPDGELLPFVKIVVQTAPLYAKNQDYIINDLDVATSQTSKKVIRSDPEGRLTISLDGGLHEVGINLARDKANLSLVSADLHDARWASSGKEVSFTVRVVNKGNSPALNVRATLEATRPNAVVTQGSVSFGDIGVNEVRDGNSPLAFRVTADSVEIEKLALTLRADGKNEWRQFIVLPLRREAPVIREFQIADGKTVTVAKSGIEEETITLGQGNGDGVANPGEFIAILVKDQGKWWRTELTGADPNLNPFGIRIRRSDNWTDMDHVGGSAKYDVPLVASQCPDNYPLELYAEYWLPKYPYHIVKRGIVSFTVRGKDTTAPRIGQVIVTGDNLLQAKIRDGSTLKRVKATLIPEQDPTRKLEQDPTKKLALKLTDDGMNGDVASGDLVYSCKIPDQVFGLFRVVIEAEDSFGNVSTEEAPAKYVVH